MHSYINNDGNYLLYSVSSAADKTEMPKVDISYLYRPC